MSLIAPHNLSAPQFFIKSVASQKQKPRNPLELHGGHRVRPAAGIPAARDRHGSTKTQTMEDVVVCVFVDP
jgi:hypothetical protein